MITLIFITLTIFVCLIALESSLNAFSKIVSLADLLIFGTDDQKSFEDLTIWKSETKIQAEKQMMIKYGKIITKKKLQEVEQAIEHHIRLIQKINTPTITTKILNEYDEPKTQSNRTSFVYIEKFFEDLVFERQFKEKVEYA